jgi:lysyl-tRNA synthetase class I
MDFPAKGELMHSLIRSIPARPEVSIEPREFFTSIYKLFLDKESGPQAGWFLAALPKDFVLARLREATR